MKIQQGANIMLERTAFAKEKNNIGTHDFQTILADKKKVMTKDRLDNLLASIEKQGERLVKTRTLEEMKNYKRLIKDFLNEVVQNGINLEESIGFNANGQEKRMKIVREIDKKLVKLSEEVISKQKTTMELLNSMGEIKGMLLNIYL